MNRYPIFLMCLLPRRTGSKIVLNLETKDGPCKPSKNQFGLTIHRARVLDRYLGRMVGHKWYRLLAVGRRH